MRAQTKHKAYLLFYLAIILVLIYSLFHIYMLDSGGSFSVTPIQFARMVLFVLVVCLLTVLYHITSSGFTDGEERQHLLFDFPLTMFATLFTVVTILQVIQDVVQIQGGIQSYVQNAFINYTESVAVTGWEDSTMLDPRLNRMYGRIFSLSSAHDGQSQSAQEAWEKAHPSIPFIPFEGNEVQWHYATKFIHQMMLITEMYGLEQQFTIDTTTSSHDTLFGMYAGWMTSFRMFMKNDLVRNVWEQTSSYYATPHFIAWVKYHITDVIDNQPNFFKDHRKAWEAQVAKIIQSNALKADQQQKN